MVLMKIVSPAKARKKKRKKKGVRISNFVLLLVVFNNIMAEKGLNPARPHAPPQTNKQTNKQHFFPSLQSSTD